MRQEPKIQISETYGQHMEAPLVEVLAWWSLSAYDRYVFVETAPAHGRLDLERAFRTYDTELGEVIHRLDEPHIPPTIDTALRNRGYVLPSAGANA